MKKFLNYILENWYLIIMGMTVGGIIGMTVGLFMFMGTESEFRMWCRLIGIPLYAGILAFAVYMKSEEKKASKEFAEEINKLIYNEIKLNFTPKPWGDRL